MQDATESYIQRAVNVWKNCEGTGDILKATYGQVADQQHVFIFVHYET